ncbi:MAG: Vps62-related protein [Chloroflexi bacterium]|nr:Vps62-related protein [Chloroflexota bacterium]
MSAESGRADHAPGVPGLGELRQQTDEEQLVAKYAPIVYLGRQDEECDSDGDPFDPAPVEIVLDNPEVTLREDAPGRPVVMEGPGAQDVFDKDIGFFLDFPGNPRRPGCTYDRDYQELKASNPPVAYAHIQTEPGFDGLALQYWFFYYFNDWNNTHEGDWEMIQLAFDADSASEALQQDPVRVAYSQHEGGEIADWDEGKVKTEEGRPAVYVARGSHANYFQPGTYIGVAREGAGFGCEDSSDPLRRVALEAQLVPPEVTDADSPFAWIEFEGRWGELQGKHFDGPTGPAQKEKWEKPFTWEQDLRSYSEKIPEGEALGIDPLGPICAIIGFGSSLMNAIVQWPAPVGAAMGVFFLATVGFLVVGVPRRVFGGAPVEAEAPPRKGLLQRRRALGQIGRDAAIMYVKNLRVFVPIGVVFIPLGIAATAVQALLRLDDHIPSQGAASLLVFSLGGAQALVSAIILGGAIFAALREIDGGRRASFRDAYRVVLLRLWTLLGANLRSLFHIVVLAFTIIGTPWAVHRAIAWGFVGQAVVLDDRGAKESLSASAEAVRGNWWRTFAILTAIVIMVVLPGPIIAMALLLFASPPVTDMVYTVNAALYSLMLLPFAFTASTLLYSDLKARKNPDVPPRNA